jgi:hypothetical protein
MLDKMLCGGVKLPEYNTVPETNLRLDILPGK